MSFFLHHFLSTKYYTFIIMKTAGVVPELRDQGLRVADFVWMMPPEKAQLYTQYGIEGLAALWQEDTTAFLCSGGVLRDQWLRHLTGCSGALTRTTSDGTGAWPAGPGEQNV